MEPQRKDVQDLTKEIRELRRTLAALKNISTSPAPDRTKAFEEYQTTSSKNNPKVVRVQARDALMDILGTDYSGADEHLRKLEYEGFVIEKQAGQSESPLVTVITVLRDQSCLPEERRRELVNDLLNAGILFRERT